MSATIYNRLGYKVFETPINKGSKAKFMLMQEDYVTLVFSTDAPIYFNLGDYYTNNDLGKRYEITDIVTPKYNKNTGGYDYELRLDAYYWKWKNKIFKYFNSDHTTDRETSWQITATPDVVLNILIRNLNDYDYKYYGGGQAFVYDVSTLENASEAKLVSFSNTNLIDALNIIAETWQCEWWITNNIIHFGKCEFGDNYVPLHTLKNGENIANVDEMSQSGNRATFATRIYAYGSDRNLPYNYRETINNEVVNAVIQKRLMLPTDKPYIDAYRYVSGERVYIGEQGYENGTVMPQEEAIESSLIFDKIYPRSTVTITNVQTDEMTDTTINEDGTETTEKWKRYRIKLSFSKQFKEEYLLLGQTLRISFESGLLNGMDFDVEFNPDKVDEDSADSQWFEIKRNEDYGRKLPDDVLKPEGGDSVVLYNWNIALMTTDDLDFISNAENELYEEAVKEIKKLMIDPNNYNCKMMSDVMLGYDIKTHTANPNNALTLEIGQRVLLLNDAYFENGERKSRIIGYDCNLDLLWDSPTYIVGESATIGRLSALESKIENLTITEVSNTRGGSGGSNIYIIRSNDITKATDQNVYSALRTDKSFARKDKDDLIKDIWSFYQHLQSVGFNSGVLGHGWFLGYNQFNDNKEGINSHLEVDTLKIRKKAMFDSLEIKHISHVGGELILSPAGATISKVEEGTLFYRCYFRNEDGTDATINQFAVGDLAMCKTFNLKDGQRYYWRRCARMGKSSDGMAYVDLSRMEGQFDPTGDIAPIEGDTIVVVGNNYDVARQNAIVISSYATGAPSISLYQGINTFELPDSKMPVRISPTLGNKFTGDFYIQVPADDGTKQVMALAEFLEDRISLGVNHRLNGENAVDYVRLGSAFSDLIGSNIYYRKYEVNEDVAQTWKVGDEIVFSFLFQPYTYGDVTNLEIRGDGVLSYMFDALDLSSAIRTGINKISGTLTCLKTLDEAIAEAEANEEEIEFGVQIRARGAHAQGELFFAQGYSAELKRTGIDIENGSITLDAKTTTIKDGEKELAIFTTNEKGQAILSTELIDADALEARRLSTKGTTVVDKEGNAIKTNYIKTEKNSMEVFDDSGALKLKVHSGTLASSSSVTSEVDYSNATGTLDKDSNGITIQHTSRFRVGNYNKLYKFKPISGNVTFNIREVSGIQEVFGAPVVNVKVLLYHSISATTIDSMEATEIASKTLSWDKNDTETIILSFEIPIEPRSLMYGNYIIAVRFYTEFPHNNSDIELCYQEAGVIGTAVTQLQEIASDGWHYQYGDTSAQKYQKGNKDAFEVLYGNYGIKVSVSGVQITKDGGVTWINLTQ